MSAKTTVRYAILLSCLLLVYACSPLAPDGTHWEQRALVQHTVDAPRVSIKTDKELYVSGEPILVTIQDHLPVPIRYMDGCSFELCHRSGREWVCQMKECYGPTTVLEPGAVAEMRVWAGAASGSGQMYRLYYQMAPDDAPGSAESNIFSIAGAGLNGTTSVPVSSLRRYFEVLDSGDYHEAARRGEDILRRGRAIPNHDELLSGFASSDMDHGRIRYTLYSLQGEASAGEIYLIVESHSGEIIEFNTVEATYER